MRRFFNPSFFHVPYHVGEGEGGDGGTDGGAANNNNNNAGKTFTQDEVNKIIQDRLARQKKDHLKTLEELDGLKKTQQLSQQERDDWEVRFKEMESQLLTKDELAAKDRKKMEEKHTKELDQFKTESETWRKRYHESTITRALTDAAVEHEAFAPRQIVGLLRSNTRLVERTLDGKPTGEFDVLTKIETSDKTLDLPVKEAIKQMKEMPEQYGNLFKSGVVSGTGKTSLGTGSNGNIDPTDTDAYMKARLSGKKVEDLVKI